MINKLTIDDVPENLKSVACAIGIDAFRSLIRCITKPVRDRVIRESFCGDYKEMARRFGISEVRVRKIVGEKS